MNKQTADIVSKLLDETYTIKEKRHCYKVSKSGASDEDYDIRITPADFWTSIGSIAEFGSIIESTNTAGIVRVKEGMPVLIIF
jgi:hypothetical protein